MEFESDKFRATLEDGLLTVWSKEPKKVRETTWDDKGKEVIREVGPGEEDSPIGKLADSFNKMPVFVAAFDNDEDMWHVDLEAGVQRWHGLKNGEEVVEALANCGFSQEDVWTIQDHCEQHPWGYVPRQG